MGAGGMLRVNLLFKLCHLASTPIYLIMHLYPL